MTGLLPFSEEAFLPCGIRAKFIDERIHRELAASLDHIAGAVEALDISMASDLCALSLKIQSGVKVPPLVFRQYYQLVTRLLRQDYTSARLLLDRMKDSETRSRDLQVTHFGDPTADQICLDLVQEGMRIAPISGDVAASFEKLLGDGFVLMKETLPALYAEILAIVHEIILLGEPEGDRNEFHGASHYQFWGLLLLNPRHHRTPLEVIEVLAHEASHSLLFGLTIAEPLVLNPDSELFPSPLREDKRPMDGIYHATYVSARMCWAMETIAACGKLSTDECAKALNSARLDRDNYQAGLEVVLNHADLSESGKRILGSAREWMGH